MKPRALACCTAVVLGGSALVWAAADLPWTFRIENHPADVTASADLALPASAPDFESVASAAGVSAGTGLDSVVTAWRLTPGISLDTDRHAGLMLLVR